MKTWAIGDLHGHFDQWIRLYNKLLKHGLHPKEDTVVFLGDYIDGGPQAKQVLDWLMHYKKLYPHWQMLYGNHEDLMLDALVYNGRIYDSFDLWYHQGGKATYESFLPPGLTRYEKSISQIKDHITVKYLDWLRKLPVYFENDKYFFVHAGVLPNFSLDNHKKGLAGGDFKEDPYSNPDWWKEKMIWIRDQFILSDFNWGKKIIYGHTVTAMPNVDENKIGMDGMFHNRGQIIALEMPEERFYYEKSE